MKNKKGMKSRDVIVISTLYCDLVLSLNSNHAHFQTNILGKVINFIL